MSSDNFVWPINEAVDYLTQRNPATLNILEKRFPEFVGLLQPGMMMGDGDNEQSRKSEFVAKLLVAVLTEAQLDADRKLILARAAIMRANKYQSWMQYLALLMSGSTLGLIGVKMEFAAQLTSAAALVGSALGLASERILAVVDPAAGSYKSIFIKLVGLSEKVKILSREAIIHVNFPGSGEALASFSGQVNALCLEIKELEAQI